MRAAIEANPTSSRRGRPRTASKGELCKFAQFFHSGGSGRAAAGKRENSDSRRQGKGFSEELIHAITVGNPASILAFV